MESILMNVLVDQILASRHGDAVATAVLLLAANVLGALYMKLSKRWVFLVPVEKVVRAIVGEAVLRTRREAEIARLNSGKGKLDGVDAANARFRAMLRANESARELGLRDFVDTVGEKRIVSEIERAVKESKIPERNAATCVR